MHHGRFNPTKFARIGAFLPRSRVMFSFYAARVGAYPSRAANHGAGLERVNGKLPIRLRQMPKFLNLCSTPVSIRITPFVC
jgi:hypothetical protein